MSPATRSVSPRRPDAVVGAVDEAAVVRSARARLIEKVKARLLAKGLPRLQMSLIVTCTGATAFVTSFLLLHAGLRLLWLRYLFAVLLAYGTFLLLVRLWLFLQRRRLGSSSGSGLDVNLGGFQIGGGSGGSGGAGSSAGSFSGGGGSFGGGGATAFFDGSGADANVANAAAVASSSSSSGGSGFSLDFNLDGDELVLVVVVVAVLATLVTASVYVVVAAPTLFAEVLVDGTLTAGLYRHVKKLDEESWLEAAVKHTWIPFAVVGLFVVAAGVVFHRLAPEAASIGGVVRHVFGAAGL